MPESECDPCLNICFIMETCLLRIAFALTGIVLLAVPGRRRNHDRTVKANTRTGIGGFLGYEVDTCSLRIPAAKIRQAPSNGGIEIIRYEQALGKETRCPGRKVRGLAYVYTPKKGLQGHR